MVCRNQGRAEAARVEIVTRSKNEVGHVETNDHSHSLAAKGQLELPVNQTCMFSGQT